MEYKLFIYRKSTIGSNTYNRIGELSNVFEIVTSKKLSKIGYLKFTLPLDNPNINLLQTNDEIELYTPNEGLVGRYIYTSKQIDINNEIPTVLITCLDVSHQLVHLPIDNRNRVNGTVSEILNCIATNTNNWSYSAENSIDTYTIDFVFDSAMSIINRLVKLTGWNWRTSGQLLEMGLFGNNSGMVASTSTISHDVTKTTNNIVINGLKSLREFDNIYNCIIPYSTNGSNDVLTLDGATSGNYAVRSIANTIDCGVNNTNLGNSLYYIEDVSSSSQFGQRFKMVSFNDIRSDDNTSDALQSAKNQLKLAAEAELMRSKDETTLYEFDILPFNAERLNVGETFRIDYSYNINRKSYLTLNQLFYVLGIDVTRKPEGTNVSLDISNTPYRPKSDVDFLIGLDNEIGNIIEDDLL